MLIQRCRAHKKRNVLDHLPEKKQDEVAKRIEAAWNERDIDSTRHGSQRLSSKTILERPEPARRPGGDSDTVNRLCLPEIFERSLRSTNVIEPVFDAVGTLTRRVKRWRNGDQVQRWVGAGLPKAESRLRKLKGYRELCLLRLALQRELKLGAGATGSKTA